METKLKYEMFIKGRRAIIGSKFFYKGKYKAYIEAIIARGKKYYLQVTIYKDKDLIVMNIHEPDIETQFFWEKEIIYQLPDTDGNLSEVKIGQHVWIEYEGDLVYEYKGVISKFIDNSIEITFILDNKKTLISNKEGLTCFGGRVTTNKPIIYQLPDTEGNLSEVKVGQRVYSIGNERKHISRLEDNKIYVSFGDGNIAIYENITGYSTIFRSITTNKPKRDFSPYFDFNQAPNGFDFGAVDEDGYAFWYNIKPLIDSDSFWESGGYSAISAGFRQNLINPETGFVDDWKDSLVMRPKDVYREVRDES